jgi:hypothetical protein
MALFLRCQRLKAAVDFLPVEELDELANVLLLAVRVVNVEGMLVHIANDERLADIVCVRDVRPGKWSAATTCDWGRARLSFPVICERYRITAARCPNRQ